jgi:ATP-binding cassette subfamily B protein
MTLALDSESDEPTPDIKVMNLLSSNLTKRLTEIWLNNRFVLSHTLRTAPWLFVGAATTAAFVALLPLIEAGLFGSVLNGLAQLVGGGARKSGGAHEGWGTFVPSNQEQLWVLVGIMLCVGVGNSILTLARDYLMRRLWYAKFESFELEILRAKARLDISAHEDRDNQSLFMRVEENGFWRIINFVTRIIDLMQHVITIVAAASVMVVAKSWILAVIIIATVPTLLVEVWYGEALWGLFMGRMELRRRYFETRGYFGRPASLSELRLSGNAGHFLGVVSNLFIAFNREEFKGERKKLLLQLGVSLLGQFGFVVIAVSIISDVLNQVMLLGTMSLILTSIANLRSSLSSLFRCLGQQYQDSLFISDIRALLGLKSKLRWESPGVLLPSDVTPEIVFSQVTASYPESDSPILKDISLTIRPGERIAIVGENGAGKSTFLKLLLRFYDPDSGYITVGGHDLRQIDEERLYDLFAVLPQSFISYHFPVREVIGLGRTGSPLDDDRVHMAARISEAASFIETLPKGYDQQIGRLFTDGIELSGGESQRLALARVLYRQGRVIVLDEPTSAADALAEERFFDNLFSSLNGQTVILISHRFSTVRRADRILVMSQGRIIEDGTHDELMACGGKYRELFESQRRGYQ